MKLAIILQSNKPEHAWNTFRLGITALKADHQVEIFLMNEGSELDTNLLKMVESSDKVLVFG